LQARPLVLLVSKPTTFLALSLPAQARYVDLSCFDINLCGPETSLTRAFRADLRADPPFSLYAVIPDGSPPRTVGLTVYGLRLGTNCQRLDLAAQGYRICDVLR
jgi:hypothetical protein